MTQGKRFGLSTVQKSDVWCRWKAGQSLHEIGRAFGKEHSSIRCPASRHGRFVPAVQRRMASTECNPVNSANLLTYDNSSRNQRYSSCQRRCQFQVLRRRVSDRVRR
jgi:hypothetical protein